MAGYGTASGAMADPMIARITSNIDIARKKSIGRREKMYQVKAIREGRWNEVQAGMFPSELPEPMVANFIDVSARSAAEAIAPLPTFTCANPNMNTEAARKSADKRTKIINSYITHSRLGQNNILAADHLESYGFTAFIVDPDFEQKMPGVYVESAFDSYYALDRAGRTVWFAKCYRRNIQELIWDYPEWALQLGELKDRHQEDVECIRYYDKDHDYVLIPQCRVVLHQWQNPVSRCRVVVAERARTGDVSRGAYDDLVWVQMARAKMGLYTMRIAEDVANAPLALPMDVQEVQVGPNAEIRTDQPQNVRRVDFSVPNQPFMELANMADELRIGARQPAARDGNMDASIITGKGVQALMAGFDAHIQTQQGRIASALTDVAAICFELDEALWPNVEKSIRGLEDGAPFEVKYKPSRDIAGDYTCSVSYGLTAGLDPNRSLVFLLQALTSGVISVDTVQRQMPFDLDVVGEQKRINVEQIRNALLGSIAALPQAIPAMAMQGGDPTELVAKVNAVIQKLQKGASIEDAVGAAFPPPPPPPQTPEDPAAAGGGAPPQDPMAALMGAAGGGAPGGASPMQETGSMGPAEQMIQSIAGTGPTGNPNLSMAARTRRPV
jgi:hypothetical protein